MKLITRERMAAEVDIELFAKNQLHLINLERDAEIAESTEARKSGSVSELEKRGICVPKLFVNNQRTGLYGKHLIKFGYCRDGGKMAKDKEKSKADPRAQLSSHCLSNGDIVGLQTSKADIKEDNISSGIVTKVTENAITVAFEDEIDVFPYDCYKLVKLCNDVTYKRLKKALETLQDAKRASHLKDVLFHKVAIGPPLTLIKKDDFLSFDASLNASQIEAVKFALNQKEIAIIHGPPGTGKTTTVIEIIKQAVKKFKFKVLACAPSNVAVDNLLAKLTECQIKVLRLGHPARVYHSLQRYSLDAVLMNSDSAEIVRSVRNDIQQTQATIKKVKTEGETRKLRNELKYLRRELQDRENKALKSVLSSADVILSTTTSGSADGPLRHLKEEHFDLVIIDEAAQALEASCWIPLNFASRCILAGDHQQLPPTIISREAAKKGLEVTLMERIIKEFGESVVCMLTTQYSSFYDVTSSNLLITNQKSERVCLMPSCRMNCDIMKWPSKQLYNGKLMADESVSSHLLSDLPNVTSDENTSIPLLFIDTAACCMFEMKHESEESKGNENEVELVKIHVDALVSAGVGEEHIGIITPYNLQVELLRQSLLEDYSKIEIRSVDGFQGREKEAIIISLVRSNDTGEVGFLREDRRLNVAITRARRHLSVIGDSQTISHHSFLKSFYDYVTEHGEVRSAQTYMHVRGEFIGASAAESITDDLLKDFEKLGARSKKQSDIRTEGGDARTERQSSSDTHSLEPSSSNAQSVLSTRSFESHRSADRKRNTERTEDVHEDHDNDAVRYTREEIEVEVLKFLESKTEELNFDSSLGSKGRFWVHELAEKYGLAHWSAGVGRDRCISIKKKKRKSKQKCETETEKASHNKESTTCEICGKKVPSNNLELHLLRCKEDPVTRSKESQNEIQKETCKQQVRKKHKKKSTKIEAKKSQQETEEEDFDALIAQFTNSDSVCYIEQCKTSVRTLGQRCQFCTRTFCIKHGLAEVHGCGGAAKIEARRSIKSGCQKTKALNNIQKNYVKKKLDKKLDEMEKKRAGSKDKKK